MNDKRVAVVDLRVDIETEEGASYDIHREGTSKPKARDHRNWLRR